MYREPIVMQRKLGLKSTVWTRRKKERSNKKRMKKQEFGKMRRDLGTSKTSLNLPTSESQGVPEGEKEKQDIENLFEQIMKENFPNLAKEIDFQEVQEAQRVPKKLDPRKNTHNYITQDYTEGENLRSSKRKGHSYLQRSSHETVS